MHEIDDTTLMAYVDGELSAAEAAAVRDRAQADVNTRARIEAFAASQRILRKTFDASLAQSLPEALLARLAPPVSERWPRRRWPRTWQWAVAAGVVAAVAVGVMMDVGLSPAPHDSPLLSVAAIGQSLEHLASGEPGLHEVADGLVVEVLPLATLRTAEGVICRDYEVSLMAADAVSERGRACRNAQGVWQPAPQSLAASIDSASYRTAAGEAGETVLERLTQAQEAALIDAGWQQP